MKSVKQEGRLYGSCPECVLISPPGHSNAGSSSVFSVFTNLKDDKNRSASRNTVFSTDT